MTAHRRSIQEQTCHEAVAQALCDAYVEGPLSTEPLPSEDEVDTIIEIARSVLLPRHAANTSTVRDVTERVLDLHTRLHAQLYRALRRTHAANIRGLPGATAHDIAAELVAQLPTLRTQIVSDVRAAYDGDPAATSIDEILLCYPGIYAVTVYRIAHALLTSGAVMIPRMMTELAHRRTGIDIHPGASIGASFFIDHGTGVVIGETAVIGNRVRLYQGVTLGALSVPRDRRRPAPVAQRHPTLEDDVVVYANATILGGATVIGKGAVIGGNAFVTTSVPAGARITATPRRD